MEGQENRSVVICIEHPVDGPPRELDDLETERTQVTNAVTRRDRVDSLGYSHLVEAHCALQRCCCGLNPSHIFACRRKWRWSGHVGTEIDA